jgi:hypothetical protein
MRTTRIIGRFIACLCGVLALTAGICLDLCTPLADLPFEGTPWFADVTEEVGLDFVHDPGPRPHDEHFFEPQIFGSGAALFDLNNDGRLALLLLQNGGPNSPSKNRLYRLGDDGRFVDISKGSGLDVAGYGMGVAIGDVNNDGLPDVLITEFGRIRLFLNLGQGKFMDVTQEAGLHNSGWGTSASFFDFDRDGWLDLVVVNYLDYEPEKICKGKNGVQPDYCGPMGCKPHTARLFRNLGRVSGSPGAVRFADVTSSSGLGALPGTGLGVVCADFNGDGWPDIFVANDAMVNRLWINRHDGTFKDEALARGVALDGSGKEVGNMGVAIGDVAGEGVLDLFVTHIDSETHTLWKQGPRGYFQDKTLKAGLATRHWRGYGWGVVFADFDNDGALDVALTNGYVIRPLNPPFHSEDLPHWSDYLDRNQVFANNGKGVFRDISLQNAPFCKRPRNGRGLVCGDLNNDGGLDLIVTNIGSAARVYRNVAADRGHWLSVRAVDPALGGRDAYGAEVTVRAGGRQWLRLVNPGSSYLCSHDPRVHFGLGGVQRVESIRVLWPDGASEEFPAQAVDRGVVLKKGTGRQ